MELASRVPARVPEVRAELERLALATEQAQAQLGAAVLDGDEAGAAEAETSLAALEARREGLTAELEALESATRDDRRAERRQAAVERAREQRAHEQRALRAAVVELYEGWSASFEHRGEVLERTAQLEQLRRSRPVDPDHLAALANRLQAAGLTAELPAAPPETCSEAPRLRELAERYRTLARSMARVEPASDPGLEPSAAPVAAPGAAAAGSAAADNHNHPPGRSRSSWLRRMVRSDAFRVLGTTCVVSAGSILAVVTVDASRNAAPEQAPVEYLNTLEVVADAQTPEPVASLEALELAAAEVTPTPLAEPTVRLTPAPLATPTASATAVPATLEPSVEPTAAPTPSATPHPVEVVSAPGLGARLRAEPGLQATIIAVLGDGTRVTHLGEERVEGGRTWRRVATPNGVEGWVDASLLRRPSPTPELARSVPGPERLRLLLDLIAVEPAEAEAEAQGKPRLAPLLQPGRESLAALALRYVGYPYVWGGTGPGGFDCSGFAAFVYRGSGIALPRDLHGQLAAGRRVSTGELAPGDLVFFQNTYGPGLTHVGIYVGSGRFVHAATEGVGVVVSSLWDGYWGPRFVGATRPG